ncbi:hypothetical protein, partial [Micromonospora rosaria]|uniref:hypothetical protein n=1 Tax=Micromonospora rosaria TaxID=47874 RepID=UPI0009FB98FD
MAHGEAEHGCAQGESCRPGHHEQSATATAHRRPACAASHPALCPASQPLGQPAAWAGERVEEELPVPRQRTGEAVAEAGAELAGGCLSERPGWAGAHRHGPVRPRRRSGRRGR